jgi:hypothetical protein
MITIKRYTIQSPFLADVCGRIIGSDKLFKCWCGEVEVQGTRGGNERDDERKLYGLWTTSH